MRHIITIHAKPAAHENHVEEINETYFRVSVKEPPVHGRANAAIILLLADYFCVSPLAVSIIRGHTSREKLIAIDMREEQSK